MYRHLVFRNQRGLYEHQVVNAEAKEAYAALLKRIGSEFVASDIPLAPDEIEAYEKGKLGIPHASDILTKVWIMS